LPKNIFSERHLLRAYTYSMLGICNVKEVKIMSEKQLHPSVQQFKDFVKTQPHLIQEVRRGDTTWQRLFEDWYLLGEEDTRFSSNPSAGQEAGKQEEASTDSSKSLWMSTVMNSLKNMDQNQVQGYIANISQALGTIQGVISQFSPSSGGSQNASTKTTQQPTGPFSFRKD